MVKVLLLNIPFFQPLILYFIISIILKFYIKYFSEYCEIIKTIRYIELSSPIHKKQEHIKGVKDKMKYSQKITIKRQNH